MEERVQSLVTLNLKSLNFSCHHALNRSVEVISQGFFPQLPEKYFYELYLDLKDHIADKEKFRFGVWMMVGNMP